MRGSVARRRTSWGSSKPQWERCRECRDEKLSKGGRCRCCDMKDCGRKDHTDRCTTLNTSYTPVTPACSPPPERSSGQPGG